LIATKMKIVFFFQFGRGGYRKGLSRLSGAWSVVYFSSMTNDSLRTSRFASAASCAFLAFFESFRFLPFCASISAWMRWLTIIIIHTRGRGGDPRASSVLLVEIAVEKTREAVTLEQVEDGVLNLVEHVRIGPGQRRIQLLPLLVCDVQLRVRAVMRIVSESPVPPCRSSSRSRSNRNDREKKEEKAGCV
jgi:hypothetical protein